MLFTPVEIRVYSGGKKAQKLISNQVHIGFGSKIIIRGTVPRFKYSRKHYFLGVEHAHIYVPSRTERKLQRVMEGGKYGNRAQPKR